jgi:hypothetical protein
LHVQFPQNVSSLDPQGRSEIVRGATGEQVLVSDSGTVNPGDMVSLIDAQQASIEVEPNCTILMKGPASLTLFENGNTLTAALMTARYFLTETAL